MAARRMPSPLQRGIYGTTVFSDPTGRTILLGWVSGFKPDRGWNGCMSLPRLLSLDQEDRLIQTPAPELAQLRGQHLKVENLSMADELKLVEGAGGDALEIKAEFVPGDAAAFGLKVRCSRDGRNGISLRYGDGTLNVAGTEVPLEAGSRTLKGASVPRQVRPGSVCRRGPLGSHPGQLRSCRRPGDRRFRRKRRRRAEVA